MSSATGSGVRHAAAARQDRLRRPRPDTREVAQLGEGDLLGERPQPLRVEPAVQGGPGQVVDATELDWR